MSLKCYFALVWIGSFDAKRCKINEQALATVTIRHITSSLPSLPSREQQSVVQLVVSQNWPPSQAPSSH